MTLNEYKDEVKDFLLATGTLNGNNQQKVHWMEEEFELLKQAIGDNNKERIEHQIYDILYLVFEMAADNDVDLEKQWLIGKKKKQEKYIDKM